jgi:hypothetical protein
VLSFSSLLLAAASSNSTNISSANSTETDQALVQGLVLQTYPGNASSTNNPAAIAAWLASGSWLVPDLLQTQGACSTSGQPVNSSPSLVLHNITVLVDPQSLARVQQALCTAAAAGLMPPNLDVIQVCSAC